MSQFVMVTVPRRVLIAALTKARTLYVQVAEDNGIPPGPRDECWSEFEHLAEYVGSIEDLIAEECWWLERASGQER